MKHQLQTIRAVLEDASVLNPYGSTFNASVRDRAKKALTALAKIERTVRESAPVGRVDLVETPFGDKLRPVLEVAVPVGTKLYTTAPPAQQPHDHVAVTWDAARTRILAVTLQDAEGRVLCVIDEAPAQQPQYEVGDMASAHNDGFRAGVASVAQQPQEEHLTITWDEHQTRILAVTMQDEDGRILKVLAEAPAQQPNEWKEAVLDWLSNTGKDFPIDTPPSEIVKWLMDYERELANLSLDLVAQQPQAECRNCGGEGKFQMYGPAWDCRACNGTGKQPQAEPIFRDMRDMANAVWAEAEAVQRAVVYGPIPHDYGAAPQQTEAVPHDMGVMELAESVGLIGPASRTDDFHAAIQRFHDLISMNVSIKAAVHFAQGLPKKGGAA